MEPLTVVQILCLQVVFACLQVFVHQARIMLDRRERHICDTMPIPKAPRIPREFLDGTWTSRYPEP